VVAAMADLEPIISEDLAAAWPAARGALLLAQLILLESLGEVLPADPLVVREVIPISNCSVRARAQDRVDEQVDPLIPFGHSMAEATSAVNLVSATQAVALAKTTSACSRAITRETLIRGANAIGATTMRRRAYSAKTLSWSIPHVEIQPRRPTQCNAPAGSGRTLAFV
jgi:hypothetical protein